MYIPETNRKFVDAVLNIEDEKFQNLLDIMDFDVKLLNDINFTEGDPCPIYWITQCWETILAKPEEWKENVRCRISDLRDKNKRIRKIFEERFGITFEPIDFYNTDFWFYRFERDDTFLETFEFESQESEKKGYRLIDLELYLAAKKFDFQTVERLLKEGANSRCTVPEYDEDILYSIGSECGSIELSLDSFLVNNESLSILSDNAMDLIYVLGLGAYERMYELLVQYDPEKK